MKFKIKVSENEIIRWIKNHIDFDADRDDLVDLYNYLFPPDKSDPNDELLTKDDIIWN
jgi:hypothetical protein